MSSPAFGHSWVRRHSSTSSQVSDEEEQEQAGASGRNDGKQLSSSVGSVTHREPIRSFIHGTVRGHLAPLDSAESARSVREQTAELANYFLSDKKDGRGSPFLRQARSASSPTTRPPFEPPGPDASPVRSSETIPEVSEPPSPEATDEHAEGPSMLTTMFRRSPQGNPYSYTPKESNAHEDDVPVEEGDEEGQDTLSRVTTVEHRPLVAREDTPEADEISPLLAARSRESRGGSYGVRQENGQGLDLEGQKRPGRTWLGRTANSMRETGGRAVSILPLISHPKRWDRRALWDNVVVAPVACFPAVVVGLLLNILDALSYGEFPWRCAGLLSRC
jgi:SulP family sulfate permease